MSASGVGGSSPSWNRWQHSCGRVARRFTASVRLAAGLYSAARQHGCVPTDAFPQAAISCCAMQMPCQSTPHALNARPLPQGQAFCLLSFFSAGLPKPAEERGDEAAVLTSTSVGNHSATEPASYIGCASGLSAANVPPSHKPAPSTILQQCPFAPPLATTCTASRCCRRLAGAAAASWLPAPGHCRMHDAGWARLQLAARLQGAERCASPCIVPCAALVAWSCVLQAHMEEASYACGLFRRKFCAHACQAGGGPSSPGRFNSALGRAIGIPW